MTFSRTFAAIAALGAGAVLSLLFITSVGAAQNFQYPKADLIITSIDDSPVLSKDYRDFRITVKNQGNKASRNSWVGIYIGNKFRRACAVPTLAIDRSATVKCRFYRNDKEEFFFTKPLKFIVDDMEEIWESNENNNTAYFNLTDSRASVAPAVEQIAEATLQPVISNPIVTVPVYIPAPVEEIIPENFGETVGEYVTCHFLNGGQGKKACKTVAGNISSQVLFCTDSICRIKISGPQGAKASFQGSCGATQSIILDGLNKNITFTCPVAPIVIATPKADAKKYPLLPIKEYKGLVVERNELGETPLRFGDQYQLGFNGGQMIDGVINITQGDTVDLGIAFEEIDTNKTNYVYKKIPNNFSIEDVIFPESVECRTRNYSDFSTIFCRGQEPFTEIIYRLRAVKAGSSEIFAKIRYSDDDEKVLDKGYVPFVIVK